MWLGSIQRALSTGGPSGRSKADIADFVGIVGGLFCFALAGRAFRPSRIALSGAPVWSAIGDILSMHRDCGRYRLFVSGRQCANDILVLAYGALTRLQRSEFPGDIDVCHAPKTLNLPQNQSMMREPEDLEVEFPI